MPTFVGIDIGTSGTRAVVIADDGRVLATASSPHTTHAPRPGWSEQDPAEWWHATRAAVRAALEQAGPAARDVAGVGLSGQMHGAVLVDQAGLDAAHRAAPVPLRHALLWNDQRTALECEAIEHACGGRAALVRRTGNAALTGFTAPKLLWLRRHEPELLRRTARLLLPKDFIALALTGRDGTDVGDASGTLLFDVPARTWSTPVLEALSIDPAWLPPVRESAAIAGHVTPAAAVATGLPAGIPVVPGSGDNMTGAVGVGVVEPGVLAGALGTSGVLLAPSARPRIDLDGPQPGRTHTMCAATGADGAPGDWCITGCMLSAGGSLRWARDVLAPGVPFDALMDEAARIPRGSSGLLFLPYLTGERCPHPDPLARGAWIGLTTRHTRAHLVRAVLEGVGLAMAQMLGIIRSLDVPARCVRLSGGGANAALWRAILAECLGLPVARTASDEGPAFGAAILAGVGARRWPSVPAACRETVRETDRAEPDAAGIEAYAGLRTTYDVLYADLRDRFPALARADT